MCIRVNCHMCIWYDCSVCIMNPQRTDAVCFLPCAYTKKGGASLWICSQKHAGLQGANTFLRLNLENINWRNNISIQDVCQLSQGALVTMDEACLPGSSDICIQKGCHVEKSPPREEEIEA